MFCKLLRYDIKAGIFSRAKVFIAPVILYVTAFINYMLRLEKYQQTPGTLTIGRSLGDALLFIYGGMKEYDPSIDRVFSFPALWMMICLLIEYLVLYYPHRDLEEAGSGILIRTGGRRLWWLSKCVWNMFSVILYYVIGWSATLVLCMVTGTPLTMQLSPNINALFDMKGYMILHPTNMTTEILLMPVLVMVTCSLLQMALSLFIRPVYSYILTMVILLAGTYFMSPILIGNYAMPIRSIRMIKNGLSMGSGIVLCIVMITISVLAGSVRFASMDILNRGD